MREFTHVFTESDEAVILAAITDSGKTFDKWVIEKIESAVKSQKNANLISELNKFADALKLSLGSGAVDSVESYIKMHHLEARVEELGGIGYFVKLANKRKGDYIPESKIRSKAPVYVSPAELAAEQAAEEHLG